MTSSLMHQFLHRDTEEFQSSFRRLLGRTPNDRAPHNVEFWTNFFLGSANAFQNSEDAKLYMTKNIFFSAHEENDIQILKLAFPLKDGLVLRSIIIYRNPAQFIPSTSHKKITAINERAKFFAEELEEGIKVADSKILILNVATNHFEYTDIRVADQITYVIYTPQDNSQPRLSAFFQNDIDIDKFKTEFQNILDNIDNMDNMSIFERWYYTFMQIAQSNNVDFCIGYDESSAGNMQILKLALRISKYRADEVILRSVILHDQSHDNMQNADIQWELAQFSTNDLLMIRKKLKLPQDINLQTVNSKALYLNEHSVIFSQNNNVVRTTSAFQSVKSIDRILDSILDTISANQNTENVELFFKAFIELYNSHENNLALTESEASYVGYLYGMLASVYAIPYNLDLYVEQSAGKGFSDLTIIFIHSVLPIKNSMPSKTILVEMKKGEDIKQSAKSAVQDTFDRGCLYNLVNRAASDEVIIVGVNCGRRQESERLLVKSTDSKGEIIRKKFAPDFFSKIIVHNDAAVIEETLESLYKSIKSDECLTLVLLGKILSNDMLMEKKVFVLNKSALNLLQRSDLAEIPIAIFTFQYHNHNYIITLTDTRNDVTIMVAEGDHTRRSAEFTSYSIGEALDNLLSQIRTENDIARGKRIDIQINSSVAQGEIKKFSDFLRSVSVSDLTVQFNNAINIPKTQYNINSINPKKLLEDLVSHTGETVEINRLRLALFSFKDMITKEKDFQSLLHGLLMGYNEADSENFYIKVAVEISAGTGRIDLLLSTPSYDLPIELKQREHNPTIKENDIKQLTNYIKNMRFVVDSYKNDGVVMIMYKGARHENEILNYNNQISGDVLHSSRGSTPFSDISDISIIDIHYSNAKELQKQLVQLGIDAYCAGPSTRRDKRSICEEDTERYTKIQYESFEHHTLPDVQNDSQLYITFAYLYTLQNQDPNIHNIQKLLQYIRNIGQIIHTEEQDRSIREKQILSQYYTDVRSFASQYETDHFISFKKDDAEINVPVLFSNGQHSLIVYRENEYYKIYSPQYNYRMVFQTKQDISFGDIEEFAHAFFTFLSAGKKTSYQIFTLSQSSPQEIITHFTQSKFYNTDQVMPDLEALKLKLITQIEGILPQCIRELFLLDGRVPEINKINQEFFKQNLSRISWRVEQLHKVLPSLNYQESRNVVNVIHEYNLAEDKRYIDTIAEEDGRKIFESYCNKVTAYLNKHRAITKEILSALSLEVLGEHISKHLSDLGVGENHEHRSHSIVNFIKTTHTGIVSKLVGVVKNVGINSMFFIPDAIRSFNNGDTSQLKQMVGMVSGDAAINSLVAKLAKLYPKYLQFINKLPISSPIFKIITLYSIAELNIEASQLPPGSVRKQIIQHHLFEEYATVGIIVLELFASGVAEPLWGALFIEQLIYSGKEINIENDLNISTLESILMSLGFEQDKLNTLITEEHLLKNHLAHIASLTPQYHSILYLIRIPKINGNKKWEDIHKDQVPEEIRDELWFRHDNRINLQRENNTRIVEYDDFRLIESCYPIKHSEIPGEACRTPSWQQVYYEAYPLALNVTLKYTQKMKYIVNIMRMVHPPSKRPCDLYATHEFFIEKIEYLNITWKRMPQEVFLPVSKCNLDYDDSVQYTAIYSATNTPSNLSYLLYFHFDPHEGDVQVINNSD